MAKGDKPCSWSGSSVQAVDESVVIPQASQRTQAKNRGRQRLPTPPGLQKPRKDRLEVGGELSRE